jgi:hypothetical protein
MISRINPELSTQEGSPRTILVVILHGYMYTPARLDPVRRVVSNEMPEADILVPELPLGVFSVVDLNEIVQSLVERSTSIGRNAGSWPTANRTTKSFWLVIAVEP